MPFHVDRTEVADLPARTPIMVNLGNPDLAFKTSFLPNDGVGLARMEFIISEYIKAHPMALVCTRAGRRPAERGDRDA